MRNSRSVFSDGSRKTPLPAFIVLIVQHLGKPVLPSIQDGVHDLIESDVLQHVLDNIINPVVAQFIANDIDLFQQTLEDSTLFRIAGHHIENQHVLFLAVPVNPSHALFESVGVPGDVPVDKQATELEVDTLSGSIGSDENLRVGPGEIPLRLATFIHPFTTMDGRYLLATTTGQPFLKIMEGIAVFGKNHKFFTVFEDAVRTEQFLQHLELLFLLLTVI